MSKWTLGFEARVERRRSQGFGVVVTEG
jgi:hypothetical protein